jgi:solute:Na+ symporter, SSS family
LSGVTFIPTLVLAQRAGLNIAEFFAAGRQAPRRLIGISLAATTFSTDTPNLVTSAVRDGGGAENWRSFFCARLRRRAAVPRARRTLSG